MLVHGLLVESVDLRRLGGSTGGNDFPGDSFDGCQVAPAEKEPGPFRRKGTRDSAADLASGSVDHRNLVLQHHLWFLLQHHLWFLCVPGWSHPNIQTPQRRENGREPSAQFGARPVSVLEVAEESERRAARVQR